MRCERTLLAAALALASVTGASAMPVASARANSSAARPDTVRVVVGGSLRSDSPILEYFRGFPPNAVKFITAAGINPIADGASIGAFFLEAGIQAEWIPVHDTNCNERTRDPVFVQMVNEAEAIYMSGGQAGRLQSCLFGSYDQSGTEGGEVTPFLAAMYRIKIVGGSSAGAMNQPQSEILITGHSAESYAAVRAGSVFDRQAGNGLIRSDELVDVHFSERGRQGRLMVMAMQTQQKWAFGADENTAYLWKPEGLGGEYEIVGEEGVVIYQDTAGDETGQFAQMHFLTQGDRINPTTGTITWNTDKIACEAGPVPQSSDSIFGGVSYRTTSLAMARAPAGFPLDNYHGEPAVQVKMTRVGNTVSMCGPSGESFANLFVQQYRDVQGGSSKPIGWVNTAQPELPLDHIWERD